MRLKRTRDIEWRDLPRIESPFFARSQVERAFFDRYGPNCIWGIDEVLRDGHHEFQRPNRDRWVLDRLLKLLETGKVFLVHDLSGKPFSPVALWEGDGEDKTQGRWVVTLSGGHLFAKSSLEWIVQRLTNGHGSGQARKTSWWDEAVGGTKEIVNQLGRRTAASLSESMGVRYVEKGTGREIDLNKEGKDLLPPSNADQEQGAQTVRNHQATVSMVMALSSKPEEFAADLEKALTHAKSESEALGKAGLEQAKRRLEYKTDDRYVDRYHGPDDMCKKNGKFAEFEAKGNKTDSKAVAKDKQGNKQGSRDKNQLRSQKMTADKAKKIGLPSNRQGGPYTQEEIDLWKEIKFREGNKQHISVHTNTETGQVKVYERDHDGDITEILDDFKMENFNEMKQAIGEAFKK